MIFYFTGTNNSLYVARKMLTDNEALVSISEAVKEGKYEYSVSEGEKVGFIFPVYFYTVPSIVSDFVSKLQLTGSQYVYAIITCGGGIASAGSVLKKLLEKKNIKLSYVREILMPDNSMLFYQIPPVEDSKKRLDDANILLEAVKKEIEDKKDMSIKGNTIVSDIVGVMYKHSMGTGKFYADADKCIGCGNCERNCAEGVIRLEGKVPKWTKDKCCKCSACINRCPVQAIQYGKSTIHRNRYVNPRM